MYRILLLILLVLSCQDWYSPADSSDGIDDNSISFPAFINQNHWHLSSPPDLASQDSSQTLKTRGRMIWYNPYEDAKTQNIWPDSVTSSQANNNTTKILEIKTDFHGDGYDTLWNGIMIPLHLYYDLDLSQEEFLDVWLNADGVQDDHIKLHIDIGDISEDWNDNGILDTEDEQVYGSMGDGILSDGEDIGVDHCTNSYEDGWGGCLCDVYDDAIYDSDLGGIYNNPTEFCLSGLTYAEAKAINPDIVKSPLFDETDPNGDNWCYNIGDCSTDDYSRINGTEGNGQAMGYRYPDTEDLNKNNTLDIRNDYFTISINPLQTKNDPSTLVVTETQDNGNLTGWKLLRIPLVSFDQVGSPGWDDVRSFRLRVESTGDNSQLLKIAKIEFGPI